MTNTKKDIEKFLQLKTLAVAGVSRNSEKFGNMIYRDLKRAGYKVFAINPKADMLEGDRCYAGLGALPEKPDGVILVLPPANTIPVIEDAVKLGITHIWLQQGAESQEGVKRCQDLGVNVISGECIFMYVEPVTSIHSFHRFIRRLFGRMPR